MDEQAQVWPSAVHQSTNPTRRHKKYSNEISSTDTKPDAKGLKQFKNQGPGQCEFNAQQVQPSIGQPTRSTDQANRSLEKREHKRLRNNSRPLQQGPESNGDGPKTQTNTNIQ